MRFGELFEYHKIPEWYYMYLDYNSLMNQIEAFKRGCKKTEEERKLKAAGDQGTNKVQDEGLKPAQIHAGSMQIKLPGYYCLNMDKKAFISLNE